MDEPDWLEKARGYIDLGMLNEAMEVIDALPSERANSAAADEMRIVIALNRKDYEETLRLSETLTGSYPGNHAGFLQGAYALHALGRTQEAIDFLQGGPKTLQEEACYFYNLACYEVALGRTEAALTWLLKSIELDPRNRARARKDEDLTSLRDQIPKKSK